MMKNTHLFLKDCDQGNRKISNKITIEKSSGFCTFKCNAILRNIISFNVDMFRIYLKKNNPEGHHNLFLVNWWRIFINIQQITMLSFHPQLFTWETVSSVSTGVFSERRVRLHRLRRTGYKEIRTVSCINPPLPGGREWGCGVKLCWGQEGFIS